MKIARVTGTLTATVKDSQLTGARLLIADIEDGNGTVLEKSVVAVDLCSAGTGDVVVIVTGSAARLPAGAAGMPVDAAIVAIADHVDIAGATGAKPSNRRKS